MHDGAQLTVQRLQMGYAKGSSAIVSVEGKSTKLESDYTPVIGTNGDGQLFVDDGGTVDLYSGSSSGPLTLGDGANGSGLIHASGKDSSLNIHDASLVVGDLGEGTVTLLDGADLKAKDLAVAQGQGSEGKVSITGRGTELRLQSLHSVGEGGQGKIEVSGGGELVVDQDLKVFSLGFGNGAEGEFDISGGASSVDLGAGQINVGDGKGAKGTLAVSGGATFDAGKLVIGNQAGSDGTVTVAGASTFKADSLAVGEHGSGTLSITGQSHATVAQSKGGIATIAEFSGGVGGVIVDSRSTLDLKGADLAIGGSLTESGGTGQLTVSNGGTVKAGDRLVLWSGGTIDVSGGGGLALSGATVKAGTVSLDAGDTLAGAGHVHGAVVDKGTIEAKGGALSLMDGKLSGGGLLKIDAGATLDLTNATGDATIGRLNDSGKLALGSHDIVVTDSYTNAKWGVGDKFNAHAGVSGSGDILGQGAELDARSGGQASSDALTVHFVKSGGKYTATLTIENSGDGADITTALQTAALGKAISGIGSANLTLGAGAAKTFNLVYDPSKGSLSGSHLTILSNFDNVGPVSVTFDVKKAGASKHAASDAGLLPATHGHDNVPATVLHDATAPHATSFDMADDGAFAAHGLHDFGPAAGDYLL